MLKAAAGAARAEAGGSLRRPGPFAETRERRGRVAGLVKAPDVGGKARFVERRVV